MKLEDWMTIAKIDVGTVAKRLGVSHTTVYRYLRKTTIPEREVMKRIMLTTKAAVCPQDFYDDIIAEALAEVGAETPRRGRPRKRRIAA